MNRHDRSQAGDATAAFVSWLVMGAIGPALVALPVNLAADKLAGAAVRWFRRVRKTDDLSRLVKAAASSSVDLNDDEFKALRALLEKEQTWSLLARGKLNEKVEALTGQIADCLPARDGRAAEDSREAARAIVRGLLEFAVCDLKEPEIFQRVVQTRLKQMIDQMSALDEALFRMHKDLYHLVDEARDLFKLVSNRLPPGPANLAEIKIYLTRLIDWLNTDPWPQDKRLGGPVLTPAVIERKLRVRATDPAHPQEADADKLARRCRRLVILGAPGSGKTWMAMRAARICAEDALKGLDHDATLGEVELPLYTTCSRLIGTHGDIREAAVSSALNWIGDLGGSRIVKALCRFFTERDEPTLLVIDSLDEASDANTARQRLRQADSLKQPWRVILTSRQSAWNSQIYIDEAKHQDYRVGELQPLHYPGDVELIIQRWFADKPEHGQALAAQIAGRPSLQQAARVPLILAFYCILGGGQPLPGYRHKLYEQVVNRMLRSPWRSTSDTLQDANASRAVLRGWAWRGAKNDQASGVAQWEDDIPTGHAQLSPAGLDAVANIAAPRGGSDFDADETLRRFVHRSIREHLVAEHVARLPGERAVQELLPHLWYDHDWEYIAPAAIVMHKEHDEVLRALLCRASQSGRIPNDLAVIDSGSEVRKLLARIAAESRESDWAPELAAIIGQARVDLANCGIIGNLAEAAHWPTSNRLAYQVLLRQLKGDGNNQMDPRPVAALARTDPTGQHQRQVRGALLGLLTRDYHSIEVDRLVIALAQLDVTFEDQREMRAVMLRQLAQDSHFMAAGRLVSALTRLGPTEEDKLQARETLLTRLARETDGFAVSQLVGALAPLDPAEEDKLQARETLLTRLARETDGFAVSHWVDALNLLDPTEEDKRQTRRMLLERISRENDWHGIDRLVGPLARLNPTGEDKQQARAAVLGLLARQIDDFATGGLARVLTLLDPTEEDKRQTRRMLLERISRVTDWHGIDELVGPLAQLNPTAGEKRQAQERVLGLLVDSARSLPDRQLLSALAQLSRAIAAPRPRSSAGLVGALALLGPTEEAKRQARDALLQRLTRETDGRTAAGLVGPLALLGPTEEQKRQARETLLKLLAREPYYYFAASGLAQALAYLEPTGADKRQAREALLALLARDSRPVAASRLVGTLAQLDPTGQDKRRARDTLLERLTNENDAAMAREVANTLAELDPTVQDLNSWHAWATPPTAELLAAVRRSSALDEWLAALPSLSPINT